MIANEELVRDMKRGTNELKHTNLVKQTQMSFGKKVFGPLSVEEIRDVILKSNPTYQAVFLSMFQGGITCGDFEYWNLHGWEDLKKDLEKDLKVIQIHLPSRMGRKPLHTYIGGDAIEAIRTYLPHRDGARETFERSIKGRRDRAQRKGEPYVEREFETAIFYNRFGVPIKARNLLKYWMYQTIRLGLVELAGDDNHGNRYGKNLHDMRLVFRRRLVYSGESPSFAEYFRGYVGDTQRDHILARMDKKRTRSAYEKVLPYLQIMSSETPFGLFKDENSKSNIDELKREIDRLKEDEDK